jgi:UDP-GlcNAc:undecaprenyl-phosphate GlcNAc-1-phosphate transferase
MNPNYLAAVTFLSSLILSLSITPLIRNIAIKRNFVAKPKEDRWHKKPTALLGGIGIFASLTAIWLLSSLIMGYDQAMGSLLPLALCSSAIFILGLVDDIFEIKPHQKLLCQIIIASLLVIFGFQIQWFTSKTANLIVSIFWIVGITNAFNLLDNMDGLAAGIAFFSGIFLFLASYGNTSLPALICLSAYLGAVLGFLVYNFYPASIFMGDSGSLFLGFVLAGLATKASGLMSDFHSGQLALLVVVPVLILFIPIMDTAFVSIMRRLFGRPISQGGRDHSSHRIVAIGFSESTAVIILYGFTILAGLLAIAITRLSLGVSITLVVIFLLVAVFFWIYLAKVKVYEEESILTGTKFTPLIINVTYKKKLFEVLLDLVLITLAYWISYLIRFEGVSYADNFDTFLKSLPIIIVCQLLSFYLAGVYRGIWQYVGLRDVISYIKGVSLGTFLVVMGILFIYRFVGFSRTIFIIDWMILILLITASRFSFRFFGEAALQQSNNGKKALIYGAGAGGQLALREIEQNKDLAITLVGFVDDDARKQGQNIRGYPVLGGLDHLEELIGKHNISELIVSFRRFDRETKEQLKKICLQHSVELSQLRISID